MVARGRKMMPGRWATKAAWARGQLGFARKKIRKIRKENGLAARGYRAECDLGWVRKLRKVSQFLFIIFEFKTKV
jgi:hypothetical protein